MIMNIIMLVCLYPTLLIVYFVIRHSMRGDGKYHYGVAMQKEWLGSDVYREVDARYKKQMNLALILAAVSPFPAFLTSSISIQYTIWMVWFIGCIFVFEVPYVLAFNRLKAYKKEMLGMDQEEKLIDREETVYVDLTVVEGIKKPAYVAFLPQILINIATAAAVYLLPIRETEYTSYYMNTCRLLVVTFAAMTLMIAAIACWMDRAKMQVISKDSRVNANYNRARKKAWTSCWLWCGWINTGLTLLTAVVLLMGRSVMTAILWGSAAEGILILLPILGAIRRINSLQKKYLPKTEAKYAKDDEDRWIWGTIYYNPQDPRLLVEQRFSMGMTFNMAKPLGIAIEVIAIAVLVITIPVSCIWMYVEERTPKQVYVEDGHLICEDTKIDYDILLSDVTSAEWKALPEERTKTNGSNWPDFEKGRYYEYWEKDFYEFCFTNQEEIIFLTVGEDKYYISCESPEETELLMEEIREQLR